MPSAARPMSPRFPLLSVRRLVPAALLALGGGMLLPPATLGALVAPRVAVVVAGPVGPATVALTRPAAGSGAVAVGSEAAGRRKAGGSARRGTAKRSSAKRSTTKGRKRAARASARKEARASARKPARASSRTASRRAATSTSRAARASARRTGSGSRAARLARRREREAGRLPALSIAGRAESATEAASVATPLETFAGVTLRGSRGAVEQAYRAAVSGGLSFVGSRREVERGAEEGAFVRLGRSADFRLRGVAVPYVRPATHAFLVSFASRYRARCGEPLVVTSALRPTYIRLPNSVDKSVHPTGMALDLRVPRNGCRTWMRDALLGLEERGVIDATEERRPAHFHVVVYQAP